MGYIDKDSLLEELFLVTAPMPSERYILQKCLDVVDQTPTADVVEVVRCEHCKFRCTPTCSFKHETADNEFCSNGRKKEEVVHARWKGAGMGDYYCSWCNEAVSGNQLEECPHCGAKMDKE